METIILVFNNASEQAAQFIGALPAFGASECVMAAVPFSCLYLLGDENRTHFLLNSTEVCKAEWELAGNAMTTLPNCTIVPEQYSVNCSAKDPSSGKNEDS